MKLKDITVKGSVGDISLLKLLGLEVTDITGYFTTEFDDVTFKLCQITFSDGTHLWFEGEHDLPYLTEGKRDKVPKNFNRALLFQLGKEALGGEFDLEDFDEESDA